MYYIFEDKQKINDLTQYIQVRDTDLKSTVWAVDIPKWDEASTLFCGYPPFKTHGHLLVAISSEPFPAMSIDELRKTYPEFFI